MYSLVDANLRALGSLTRLPPLPRPIGTIFGELEPDGMRRC